MQLTAGGATEVRRPGYMAPAMLSLFLLLLGILILSSTTMAQSFKDSDPIHLIGDANVDAFFEGTGGDGLSPETAYVLEGIYIVAQPGTPAVEVENTTRYIEIRDCRFFGTSTEPSVTCVRLTGTTNITLEGNDVRRGHIGIQLEGCYNETVIGNRFSSQGANGILLIDCVDILVEVNELEGADTAILVKDCSWTRMVSNDVRESTKGIELAGSEFCHAVSNFVELNFETGIRVIGSRNCWVTANEVVGNWGVGIEVSGSSHVTVDGNEVSDNMGRGIHLTGNGSHRVLFNNVSANSVGLRLHYCDGNLVDDNRIERSRGSGVVLVGSEDNTVSNNYIGKNMNALELTASWDNEVVDNDIFANMWGTVKGGIGRNTYSDNDERANGWLKSVFYLIVFLLVLGIALGAFFWLRSRRRRREEMGDILVRRRFPAGNAGLWGMSRYLWDEDFFQAQLASSGPQREQVLERYKANIAQAKQMQYFATGTMAVMLAFMAALPLGAATNIIGLDVMETTLHDTIFANSVSIALYYVMSFLILLVFGLLFLSNLMKGETFQLLSTLPLDRKGLRRIVLYMLFRMYGLPFGVVLLAFPVGGFFLTRSPAFLASTLFVNAVYLVFIAYVMIIIANIISRRVFSASATRGATVLRIMVMAGYLISMMMVFVTIEYISDYIRELYASQALASGDGVLVNSGLSVVPFPMSGAYLITLSLLDPGLVPVELYASTGLGLVLLIAMMYGLSRVANRILTRVAKGAEVHSVGARQTTTEAQLGLAVTRPLTAFMRNSLLVTSRDMGSLMYIIMPIIFPFIMIFGMLSEGEMEGFFEPVFPYLIYIGITPFLLNMALSTSDAEMGGVLSALPFGTRTQYRSKQALMLGIMIIPLVFIIVLFLDRVSVPLQFLAFSICLVPLSAVLVSIYLISFSAAFGYVNRRYTFFMAKISKKFAKYVGIILLQYVVLVFVLGAFGILTLLGLLDFWGGIVLMLGLSLGILAVTEVAAGRMFG